jgi:diguanylate cyclase (GGDEF)-like protein
MSDLYLNPNDQKQIFFFEKDLNLARDICSQLELFGYKVSLFTELNLFLKTFEVEQPDALIMHISLNDPQSVSGITIITRLQQKHPHQTPIIYISETDTLAERVQAVKSGGEAFFISPVDVGSLVDSLDTLTQVEPAEKYRVLIVDDSVFQSRMFARLLEQQGVICQLMNDPMQILQQLADFNPDLVLLDMYMPRYSGLELAKVMRQMEKFVGLPIVFLSSETDKGIQLEAMSLGGDDFLDKAIKPAHFYPAISSRIERYRKLRTLMTRDGLTGLNNHTLLMDRLTQELLRANRYQTSLSFAMIDIDHFKQVNDAYGHQAGDRVLKSVARLLKQRLRASDVIGRYGGEEFAIVMPQTAPESAVKVINELRTSFANLRHSAGNKEFQITFSAGVASFPAFKLPVEISDSADKALYTAKRNGRNQVILAEN